MKWISVEDRLPEKNKKVLIWIEGYSAHSGMHWTRKGYWLCPWHGDRWAEAFMDKACEHLDMGFAEVTHWMPLPEPPEEE